MPGGLHRGEQYDAWSFSPQPTPAQLARSKPEYPPEVMRYLELFPGEIAPPFGTPGRRQAVERLLANPAFASYFADFRPLYDRALKVIGRARSPYGAAVALESWFRQTGGFTYTQQPPRTRPNLELVDFVTRTKQGYCQHFAGAMALMLRYLGVPARVAAGFTSGTYDGDTGTWTVTDHDAHAWVEVWFRGYGWLPFDPTPGRGSLSAPYTASSTAFDPAAAAAIVAGALASALSTFNIHQEVSFGEKGIGSALGSADARRAPADGVAHPRRQPRRLLALALAIVVLLVSLAKTARRRARYASRDPRRVAAACRAELRDFLADQGVPVAASAGPQDIVRELRERLEVDAGPFARALAVARFGLPADAAVAAEQAKRELASLRAQIRSRIGVLRRARGLVSLRSLGFAD